LRDINHPLFIGVDVGSTTVKAVVMDENDKVVWKKYGRHNSRQPESVLAFLQEIEGRFFHRDFTVFTTGNGGRSLAPLLNASHVQEVNAVTVAVEKLHPKAGSAVELGGQDAKIIIWKPDRSGRKTTLSFMNDKCAGGTGATIDKIFAKIGLASDDILNVRLEGHAVHNIAAKCGVFAETDAVGLMKAGVKEEEIVISLCNAIVKQNIEVLLHSNLLRTDVLLLGGPHRYFRVFEELWRKHIPETWRLHHWSPPNRSLDTLIYVPPDAEYFAAIGAVLFGRQQDVYGHGDLGVSAPSDNQYPGIHRLDAYIGEGREAFLKSSGHMLQGLVQSEEEARVCMSKYAIPEFEPPAVPKGETVQCYIGIDGGSTSSKLALINGEGLLLYKDYVLSKGNPILDVRDMFERINSWCKDNRIDLRVMGTGVTGYASAILKQAFALDTSIVETVAHLKSATHYYGDIDVICDVGGQDIKVLFIKHNRVVDIKLNTQCSAGNGYFLQNMAHQFGIPLENFAEAAMSARKAPSFNYGCAVFMEQDKVNFQQLGWSKEEIMAGLALVLPLNIWNFVVQESDLKRFGTKFLLQGGTQKNPAAVKAQADFIESKVPCAKVMVHRYADIAGALGAALEAKERAASAGSFIGLSASSAVAFTSKNNETTICRFCSNACKRTFIDIEIPGRDRVRYIIGYGCEKGMSDDLAHMKQSEQKRRELLDGTPNLVREAAHAVFARYDTALPPKETVNPDALMLRGNMVIGIPKLLNLFLYAPFFNAYFRSIGVRDVVYSDFTNDKLWSEGNKWGAIDPCFPAKVAPAHIYNLLKRNDVTHVCFPMVTHLESMVENTLGNNACVIQMGTSEVVHAAFTKHRDMFRETGKPFWKPLVRMDRPREAEGNLFEYFKELLQLTEAENQWAVAAGYAAMAIYLGGLREKGAEVIDRLVEEDRMGILFIGHPYHHDPGLNHGILEAFQLRGFPILCVESLPVDRQFLDPLFSNPNEEASPFDISDVWRRCFNRNTNAKIWAAKVAARHPNLAVIDLSSFKCGHDAPTYSYVSNILDASETPHFLFHDLDQNKPSTTFNIRIESIDYFLRQEEMRLKEAIVASSTRQGNFVR
jgi:activator of 2-hydroxyglutaryl-CoA dehydratase/predicted nucleotide-binding protein (sugar kinase/HSP70/actin superfamily)